MKTNYFFKLLLFSILFNTSICTISSANSKTNLETQNKFLNVTRIAFTVPSAGWYRVGELTRGLIKVAVSITGGAHKPQNLIIEAYKDWGSGLFLRAKGSVNNYITEVRLTNEAGKYYIEIYATQALTQNAYFYHYETEGYARSLTLNSGTLPLGGGEVKKETGNLYNKSYTSGGMIVEGNIGIGISTPSAKLHVDGNIISEEIKVEDVTGADFVFAPNYNLMPLSQIEAYIKENQHLPEVPSAAEMQANGIKLGKMNMLLLQKIEELTLHVIELKKENERQNNKIALQDIIINELKK